MIIVSCVDKRRSGGGGRSQRSACPLAGGVRAAPGRAVGAGPAVGPSKEELVLLRRRNTMTRRRTADGRPRGACVPRLHPRTTVLAHRKVQDSTTTCSPQPGGGQAQRAAGGRAGTARAGARAPGGGDGVAGAPQLHQHGRGGPGMAAARRGGGRRKPRRAGSRRGCGRGRPDSGLRHDFVKPRDSAP